MTEQALLEAARTGDEDAFARLVSSHRSALEAHCYRMLGSVADAEDAMQDALLRAWRGLGSFRFNARFSTWMYRIVVRKAYDTIERRRYASGASEAAAFADAYATVFLCSASLLVAFLVLSGLRRRT